MRQDVLRCGDGSLWPSAAVVIRIDRREMRWIKIGEVISGQHYVVLREENHGVAIGVAMLKVNRVNVSAFHVQGELIGKRDCRERDGQVGNPGIMLGGHFL